MHFATDKKDLVKFDFVLVSFGEHSLKVLMSLLHAIWLIVGTLVSAASYCGGLQHQGATAGLLACMAMLLGVEFVNAKSSASAFDSAAAAAVAAAKVAVQSVAQSKVLCFGAASDHLPRMLHGVQLLADATPNCAN